MSSNQQLSDIAVERKISPFPSRFSQPARYLVKKNLATIVNQIITDINQFQQSNFSKLKSCQSLKNMLLISETEISEHADKIIPIIQKYLNYEEVEINQTMRDCAEILGLYVSCDIMVPIILEKIKELDSNSQKSINSYIFMMGQCLKHVTPKSIENHLNNLISLLQNVEQNSKQLHLFSDQVESLQALYHLTATLVNVSGDNCTVYCRQYFASLLLIQAHPSLPQQMKDLALGSMETLSRNCGYSQVNDLFLNEMNILLTEYLEQDGYTKWNKYSSDRYKFEIIIRNCLQGVVKYIEPVMKILKNQCAKHQEVEIKMDTLILVEFLLEGLKGDLAPFAKDILKDVLIPSSVWRVGKAQIKVRKASMVNMVKMIQLNIIPPQDLHECFEDILPIMKTCLTDDWGPDLRFITCNYLEHLLAYIHDLIDSEQLREIYPSLLERLDDGQDMIRVEITKAITNFFRCKQLGMSPSTFEYMIKQIFVHLDDHNQEISMSIYNVLLAASDIDHNKVYMIAKEALSKQKFPRKCEEIIRYCQEKNLNK